MGEPRDQVAQIQGIRAARSSDSSLPGGRLDIDDLNLWLSGSPRRLLRVCPDPRTVFRQVRMRRWASLRRGLECRASVIDGVAAVFLCDDNSEMNSNVMIRNIIIIVDIVMTMFLIIPFIILANWSMKNWKNGHDKIVDNWAAREGYRLVKKEPRMISPWIPFPSAQRVYRVVLEDMEGRILDAWVRTGGVILGQGSQKIEIHRLRRRPEGHPDSGLKGMP
jgi:hypothetical protein